MLLQQYQLHLFTVVSAIYLLYNNHCYVELISDLKKFLIKV
jgi:hypothetical protein